MREAEADPGLRAMSGLTGSTGSSAVDSVRVKQQQQQQRREQQLKEQRQQRERRQKEEAERRQRAQVDLFVAQDQQRRRQQQLQRQPQQQRQQQQPFNYTKPRSQSADTRRPPPQAKLGSKSGYNEPRLEHFKRSSSTENLTEEIMHEVVTDQEHHSVKDLVAMIEKNTNAESANPYVRKWGCDLISPEPHAKNVTYRRERRALEEEKRRRRQEEANAAAGGRGGGGSGSGGPATATEDEDEDDFPLPPVALPIANGTSSHYGGAKNHHHQQQQQQGASTLDNDFRLSAHVADLDSLIGRQKEIEEQILSGTTKEVAWPPPPLSASTSDQHPSRAPALKVKAETEAELDRLFMGQLDAMVDNKDRQQQQKPQLKKSQPFAYKPNKGLESVRAWKKTIINSP